MIVEKQLHRRAGIYRKEIRWQPENAGRKWSMIDDHLSSLSKPIYKASEVVSKETHTFLVAAVEGKMCEQF